MHALLTPLLRLTLPRLRLQGEDATNVRGASEDFLAGEDLVLLARFLPFVRMVSFASAGIRSMMTPTGEAEGRNSPAFQRSSSVGWGFVRVCLRQLLKCRLAPDARREADGGARYCLGGCKKHPDVGLGRQYTSSFHTSPEATRVYWKRELKLLSWARYDYETKEGKLCCYKFPHLSLRASHGLSRPLHHRRERGKESKRGPSLLRKAFTAANPHQGQGRRRRRRR